MYLERRRSVLIIKLTALWLLIRIICLCLLATKQPCRCIAPCFVKSRQGPYNDFFPCVDFLCLGHVFGIKIAGKSVGWVLKQPGLIL